MYCFNTIQYSTIQDVLKLVIQNSAVITSELEVTIWSDMSQKLRLVLKFPFKPPDGILLVRSCEVLSHLNRAVAVWIGRGGTLTLPPRSPNFTPPDFSVWGYTQDEVFVPLLPASLEGLRARIT